MTRPSRNGGRAVLLALSLAACGPYGELAQKLDVTARIAGDTWIAAGPNRATDTRVLLVGRPDPNGVAPFAFTCVADDCPTPVPVKNVPPPIGAATLQGTWSEVGSGGDATLRVAYTYATPADTGAQAGGSQRNDTPYALHLTVVRTGNRLVVSGDPQLSGTYVALSDALAGLGTATARDAACAYQVASLSIQGSETRIIGFGGGGMVQYRQPATYVGTIAGSVTVSMSGLTPPIEMRIRYDGFEDEGGVRLDGTQVTTTGWDGKGSMSSVVRFTIAPPSLDPATVTTPITGGIDYSGITLNGTASGSYHVTIDGGGTGDVSAVGAPSPSVAECLNLP